MWENQSAGLKKRYLGDNSQGLCASIKGIWVKKKEGPTEHDFSVSSLGKKVDVTAIY